MSGEMKEVKNDIYHAAVVSGLSVGYSMILKNLLKISPPSLGKMEVVDSLKLVGVVSVSMWTKDWLVKQKIIPDNI